MTDRGAHSPRRYYVDGGGRRVLVGLTIEETFEFETLDHLPTRDDSGDQAAWDASGMPPTTRETRWLELYTKHDSAWRAWMSETCADRNRTLTNY
jgi:hypothetical protein